MADRTLEEIEHRLAVIDLARAMTDYAADVTKRLIAGIPQMTADETVDYARDWLARRDERDLS